MRNTRFVAGGVLAAALLAGLLVAGADAQNTSRPAVTRWAYGQLQISGKDAVFQTPSGAFFLEGPDDLDPRPVQGEQGLSVLQPVSLIHLNTLGADGWDLVRTDSGAGGVTYLLQRPY